MIIEAHVPSFGVLGAAAIVSLLVGGNMIIEQGGIFGIPLDWPIFLGIATGMMIVLVIMSRVAINGLKKPIVTGAEGLINQNAKIVDWNGKDGRVSIQGEMWQARSAHAHNFQPGDIVTVAGTEDMVLHIHPKN